MGNNSSTVPVETEVAELNKLLQSKGAGVGLSVTAGGVEAGNQAGEVAVLDVGTFRRLAAVLRSGVGERERGTQSGGERVNGVSSESDAEARLESIRRSDGVKECVVVVVVICSLSLICCF